MTERDVGRSGLLTFDQLSNVEFRSLPPLLNYDDRFHSYQQRTIKDCRDETVYTSLYLHSNNLPGDIGRTMRDGSHALHLCISAIY